MPDPETGTTPLAPSLTFPTQGTANALFIFVQNQDDMDEDECFDSTRPVGGFYYRYPVDPATGYTPCRGTSDTPAMQSRSDDPLTEWPYDRSTTPDSLLPSWVSGMVATPGTLPANFPPGSLSEYYRLNSGGRFVLTGYVYPKAYVPAHPPSWYQDSTNLGAFPNGGVKLSHEILTYVNTHRYGIPLNDPAIFDRYTNGTDDLGADGLFDMVVFVFRRGDLAGYGVSSRGDGISSLGSNYYSDLQNGFSSSPVYFGGPGGLQVVDNYITGSGVWAVGAGQFRAQATTAHEIGHRQFGLSHEGGESGRTTGQNPQSIMWRASLHPVMFTAPDRLNLGWATVDDVDYGTLATGSTTRTLGETFASGRILIVRNGPLAGDLIVESRTQSNAWDRPAGPSNPYADGDVDDYHLPQDGLLVYKRESGSYGQYSNSVENTGLLERGFANGVFRPGVRLAYSPGDAYTPLTRTRFYIPQDTTLDRRFAITDIARSGSGFSMSLWRDFLTAPGVKSLGTNYTLANHGAGPTYPDDRNMARSDDFTLGGTVRLAGGLGRVWAGTPTLRLLADATLDVPAGSNVTLEGPPSYTFPVRSGQNARVEIGGQLFATRVMFTASDPAVGWGGVRFNAGSGGVIDGSVIERVRAYGGTALSITGASPTIRDTQIRDSPCCGITGVTISGSGANPLLQRNVITGLGAGVSVYNYAQPRLVRNQITLNGGDGLRAGYQSTVFLAPEADMGGRFGNDIVSNTGTGVYASGGAYVNYAWYFYGGYTLHNDGYNYVSDNRADGNVAVDYAALAAGNSDNLRRNEFSRNAENVPGGLDVRASGSAARAYVNCNYWGPGSAPPFRTAATSGATLYNASYLTRDPRAYPFDPCIPIGSSAGRSGAAAAGVAGFDEANSDGLEALADAVSIEDPVVALAVLEGLIAGGGSLVAPALAEVGRLARREGAPDGALRLLEQVAGGQDAAAQQAALGALIGALGATGDDTGSLRAADALVATGGREAVLAGQTARAYLLTDAGRMREAINALAAAAVLSPQAAEVEIARAYVARAAGRSTESVTQDEVLSVAAESGASGEIEDGAAEATLGAPQPNPASRVTTIPLALPAASDVRLVFYDALGREAAVLVDGRLEAGRHRVTFDAGTLAPGAYMLRARVATEGGERTLTGRVTVVR